MSFASHIGYDPTSPLMISAKSPPGSAPSSPCCESGRPIMTDPMTGQTICSCQLTTGLPFFPRVPGLPESMYGMAGAFPHPGMLGAEPSAFYPLTAGQPLGVDRSDQWKVMTQAAAAGLHGYDPVLAAHPYNSFYTGLDLNSAARRKNATRETTSALKAWLYEHRKNPYPTKGEKIMLAIITKMTLTQVSTWFANARRRLKKESKMGWGGKDKDDEDQDKSSSSLHGDSSADDNDDDGFDFSKDNDDMEDIHVTSDLSDISDAEDEIDNSRLSGKDGKDCCTVKGLRKETVNDTKHRQGDLAESSGEYDVTSGSSDSGHDEPSPSQNGSVVSPPPPKPKIWSITEIMSSSGPSERKENSFSANRTPHSHHTSRHSIMQYDSALKTSTVSNIASSNARPPFLSLPRESTSNVLRTVANVPCSQATFCSPGLPFPQSSGASVADNTQTALNSSTDRTNTVAAGD